MGKKRKGGLPYLKTTLKFDWDSSRGVAAADRNALLSDVCDYLEKSGCSSDDPEPSSSKHFSAFSNNLAGFGLQACFDLVKSESAPVVFIDASVTQPRAVGNALGLYFSNFSSSADVYCLCGIEELVFTRLRRRTNAFILRSCPEELKERLKSTFSRVHVQSKRSTGMYTPVSLIKSQGKSAKIK